MTPHTPGFLGISSISLNNALHGHDSLKLIDASSGILDELNMWGGAYLYSAGILCLVVSGLCSIILQPLCTHLNSGLSIISRVSKILSLYECHGGFRLSTFHQ